MNKLSVWGKKIARKGKRRERVGGGGREREREAFSRFPLSSSPVDQRPQVPKVKDKLNDSLIHVNGKSKEKLKLHYYGSFI